MIDRNVDDLDTVLYGIRQSALESQRRKRDLRRLRITMTVAVVLIGAALLAGAVALVVVVR